jgi:hypothetical protein
MTSLFTAVFGPVATPILIIVILVLAVIVFALCKKQSVRAGVWSRSCGFVLEAQDQGCRTAARRTSPRKKPSELL